MLGKLLRDDIITFANFLIEITSFSNFWFRVSTKTKKKTKIRPVKLEKQKLTGSLPKHIRATALLPAHHTREVYSIRSLQRK